MAHQESVDHDDPLREKLLNTTTCHRYLQAGLGVILLTFLATLVAVATGTPDPNGTLVVTMTLPSLFVGLGLLLFGVGTHLHLLHLNVVQKLE